VLSLPYLFVFLLGVLVGVSELLSRYKDAHRATFKSFSSLLYIFMNGLAAYLALYLMYTFNWAACDADGCSPSETVKHVLMAGFGGMAVLRASVMTLTIQGNEVGIGPAAVIQIFLKVADRGTDRARASVRADTILKLMEPVSFEKASIMLPTTCFALMQNVSAEEQALVSGQVVALQNDDMPSAVKSYLLGLALLPIVGEAGLRAGIDLLGDQIKT